MRVARCTASRVPPQAAAKADAAKVPVSSAYQLVQPGGADAGSELGVAKADAAWSDQRQGQIEAGQGGGTDGRLGRDVRAGGR